MQLHFHHNKTIRLCCVLNENRNTEASSAPFWSQTCCYSSEIMRIRTDGTGMSTQPTSDQLVEAAAFQIGTGI